MAYALTATGTTTGGTPSLADTMASEWVKLRTLRTTLVTITLVGLFGVGLSALVSFLVASHGVQPNTPAPLQVIQGGWELALLTVMVFGVMAVTNEFSSGLAVATYLATPKRARVLVAKVAVFTVVVFVSTEVFSFVGFFLGHAIIGAYPAFPNVSLSDNNVLRCVVGMGIFATLLGLLGMGAGAIIRHTAGGIAACVGFIFILPGLLSALPASWSNPIGEYWPTQAGHRLITVAQGAHSLTAWWGAADLAGFVVLVLVVAGVVLDRHDT